MTRAEAIKQVLQNLTVLDAISQPAAEDAATVGARLDQVRAELTERGLCWWDADSIPESVSGAFCDRVAEACGPAFGKAYDANGADKRIAAVKSPEQREPIRQEYF